MARSRPSGETISQPGLSERVARNTGWQVGGEAISRLSTFVLIVAIAREVSLADFGVFTFAVSLAVLLTLIGGLGADYIVMRAVARDPASVNASLAEALAVKSVGAGAAIAIAIPVALLGDYDAAVAAALVAIVLAACLDMFADTAFAIFQGVNDLAPQAIARSLQGVTRAALGIAFVFGGAGLLGVSLAYLGSAVLATAYGFSRLRTRLRPRLRRPSRHAVTKMAKRSLPIAFGDLVEVGTISLITVALSVLAGNAAVGLLGAASRVVTGFFALSFAFTGAVAPLLANAAAQSPRAWRQVYEASLKALVVTLLPVSAGMLMFAGPLMEWVFGDTFSVGRSALALLAPTVLLHGVSQLAFYTLIATERQRTIPLVASLAAAVTLTSAFILIPILSYDGAALASLAGAAVYAVAGSVIVLRDTGAISISRVALAPVAGLVVMIAASTVVGETLWSLVLSMVLYAAAFLVVELVRNPDDVRRAFRLVRGI